MDTVLVIFWGLILLTVIIVIHEAGHFLAARLFGVRVIEFAVGLPGFPSIGRTTRRGTRVALTCVPLGGYNRIAGMMAVPEDHREIARAYAYLCKYGTLRTDALPSDAERLDFEISEHMEVLADWGTIIRGRADDGSRAIVYQTPATEGAPAGTPREVDDSVAFIESEHAQTYDARPFWKRAVILLAGSLFNIVFFVVVVTSAVMVSGSYVASQTISAVTDGSPAAEAGFEAT
jgi:regulator of sigma E protease